MQYFLVEPETPGGLGENSKLDPSTHPPVVTELHFVFDDWFGDVLLTSFPVYLVTMQARSAIEESALSGARFEPVQVTTSGVFEDLNPRRELPSFAWLQVTGLSGKDDFGMSADHFLVVSERALDVLRRLGIPHAEVSEIAGS
jgi:hypothetical protein